EGGPAVGAGQLGQAHAVGAVAAAQHDDGVGLGDQLLDRLLAVLGGVADVVARGADDVGEPAAQGVDDALGVVDAEGGPGEVGDPGAGGQVQAVDVVDILDQA